MARVDAERELLRCALEAACRASWEADHHTQSSRERLLLNEQWAQSYIGFDLNDLLRERYASREGGYVTFETCVNWLEGFIGEERGPGRIAGSLRSRQRFDIVLWSKGGRPAAVIEIKDQPVMQSYSRLADPLKLCGALRRWPSLRWAMFLFSVRTVAGGTKAEVNDRLRRKAGEVFAAIEVELPGRVTCKRSLAVPGQGSKLLWAGAVFRERS
jgi:hypothetical protein